MEILRALNEIEQNLSGFVQTYGPLVYGLIFLLCLTQTGFFLGPALPGSTLVFVAGLLARTDPQSLNILMLIAVGWTGAYGGCWIHYWLGRLLQSKLSGLKKGPFRQERLAKTAEFIEKHGRWAMVWAPFIPFVRTFSGFVAGLGGMPRGIFGSTSAAGCLLWVGVISLMGYFLGQLPGARQGVIVGVVVVSTVVGLKVIWSALKARRSESPAAAE